MEREGKIRSEGCTNGQPQRVAGYEEDGVRKGLDQRIDEGVLLWFGHV